MSSSLPLGPEEASALAPYQPSLLTRATRYLGLGTIPRAELEARYTNSESRFIEVDGTRVHYRTEGSGPPLLLLHGVLSHLQTWDGWVEQLKHHFTVTRIDVPGFGLTGPMASGDYSPEYALHFFEQARAAFGYERFAIAGNSLGGFLGWWYAANHPERVDKLILVDPLSYPQTAPLLMRFVTAPIIRSFVPYTAPRPFIRGALHQVYGDISRIKPGTIERYHDLLLGAGGREAMLAYFDKAEMMFEVLEDGRGRYARKIADIQCPTLIQWGEDDPWIPLEHVDSFLRDLPHAQVKRYPGLGHIPMEEAPDLTVTDALAFLKG